MPFNIDTNRPVLFETEMFFSYDFALQNCFCDFAWPKKRVLQFVLVNKNSFAILCDKHVFEWLKLPQKMPVFITLGPCVGLFVAVLYMISRFFDLAYWTLTLPINWIFFTTFTCITLLRVKNSITKLLEFFCATHAGILPDSCCEFARSILCSYFAILGNQ